AFITNYIGIPIFFFSWLGYKLLRKSTVVPLESMDLHTGVHNYDGEDQDGEDEEDIEKAKAVTMKQKLAYYIKNW
ncbi:unnamed protein product, partial [Tilletia controversa]